MNRVLELVRAPPARFLSPKVETRGPPGEGFLPNTSTLPGSSRPLLRSLPLLYMLIVSGKSSLIGRIRQSKRIVSQAEPN